MAVNAADVRRVALKYLDPESIQLVAVGDGSKIKAGLEKYGRVEIYDDTGQAIPAATP